LKKNLDVAIHVVFLIRSIVFLLIYRARGVPLGLQEDTLARRIDTEAEYQRNMEAND
jgi:hypothetical protein